MSDISKGAGELAGRAKQSVGDLTGNEDLQAEGQIQEVKAKVKQAASDVSDRAEDLAESAEDKVAEVADRASELGHKAADTAGDLHLDDKRVTVALAAAGVALVVVLLTRRAAKRTARKHPVARGTVKGIGRALSS